MADEEGAPPTHQNHAGIKTMATDNRRYKGDDPDRHSLRRAVCAFVVVFLLLEAVTALVVWLVYRPNKPQFTVTGASIYYLNDTSPPLFSTTVQFTLVTRNTNKRVSIYYDDLTTYVVYRDQAITPTVSLQPLYHAKHSTVAVSPIFGGSGAAVPISMEVANGLIMDEAYGVLGLRLVLLGRIRWKAGAIKTAHYGLYVKCDVMVGYRKGVVGQMPLLAAPKCKVDV